MTKEHSKMCIILNKNEYPPQSGSIIFFILLAVALMAALSFTMMRSDGGGHNITREKLIILSTETEQYASQLKQAVEIVLDTGISEIDISFAHADAPSEYGDPAVDPVSTQVFSYSGGQADYKTPNPTISSSSQWEFYGESQMPQVGSSRADLIAVLPDVTEDFCDIFNERVGLDITSTYPEDTATCFKDIDANRFNGVFNATPNTLNTATFSVMPALRACVKCGSDYHAYMVLYAR